MIYQAIINLVAPDPGEIYVVVDISIMRKEVLHPASSVKKNVVHPTKYKDGSIQ